MRNASVYQTKHREYLLDYFHENPGSHFTVSDLLKYFREKDIAIGQATIYRQLEKMVDEGILNKYIIDKNTPACFEYIPDVGTDKTETDCFHCKCEICGKLIHLHCVELSEIRHHLLEEHQFALNPLRTVFYGRCADCMKL